ncbi:unnamed protein product [Sphagnum balticum]
MHQCFPNHLHRVHDCHSVSNPEQIKVTHVKLNLLADFVNEELSGIATLRLERAADCPQTAPLVLDTKGLEISEVNYVGPHVSSCPAPFHFGHPDPILGTPLIIKLPEDALEVIIQYKTTKDSQALQWLPKTDSRDKLLFTQSQAILARTWIPLQDSPSVRITYDAVIEAPAGFTALMSAERKPTGRPNLFRFSMPHSIPPYLLALAVGKLAFAKVGKRTGVWAEPHVLAKAASEFHDMESMLEGLEKLVGPYPWGRWDALILPASFPFGGMENPCLTFVTPTLLAGDRSLVSVMVHELAHAKSGNEVTNATAADFFLNEGWTVYLERRLLEVLYGRERAAMESVLGREALLSELKKLPASDQILHIDLSGRDPDDGMTDIPYEKGYLFLLTLEKAFGRRVFDRFMRGYFKHFSFQSITTEQFVDYLNEHLLSTSDMATARRAAKIDLRQWLSEPGLPKHARMHSKSFVEVSRAARSFKSSRNTSTIIADISKDAKNWSTHAWLRFLRALADVSAAQMKQLDGQFHLSETGNSEILHQWLMMSVRCNYKAARPVLEYFLATVGRRGGYLALSFNNAVTEPTPIVMAQPSPAISLLLNRGSYELTDFRHTDTESGAIQYDEICLTNQHLRLIFWEKNRENMVLEYFPAPPPHFPFSNRWSFEQTCPTITDVAAFVARDSNGEYSFEKEANGHLKLIVNPKTATFAPQVGIALNSTPALYARIYLDSAQKFDSEDVRFIDQTPQKIAIRLADGSYEETFFYANKNVARHRITDKNGVLTQEEVKSYDGFPTSTMVRGVSNTLKTTFDPDTHLPLWQDNNRSDGQNSTITAYVSGTTKVRMKAEYNFIVTSATYFRDDDTIDHVVTVNPTDIQVAFFDKTGKVEIYDQVFVYDRVADKASNLRLIGVRDLDAKGNVAAIYRVSFDGKYVEAEQRSNVTANGVTYARASYLYRADGTLSEVQYVPTSGPHPPVETHTETEGIKSAINVEELKPATIDSELPLPPVRTQTQFFGR